MKHAKNEWGIERIIAARKKTSDVAIQTNMILLHSFKSVPISIERWSSVRLSDTKKRQLFMIFCLPRDDWKQLRFLPEKVFIENSYLRGCISLPPVSFNPEVHLIDKSAFLLFQHLSTHFRMSGLFSSSTKCVFAAWCETKTKKEPGINCRSVSLPFFNVDVPLTSQNYNSRLSLLAVWQFAFTRVYWFHGENWKRIVCCSLAVCVLSSSPAKRETALIACSRSFHKSLECATADECEYDPRAILYRHKGREMRIHW